LTDSELIFSPQKAVRTFADVVLPLALPKPFTYVVPESLVGHLKFGMRVEVQFGRNRLYSGLVVALHQRSPQVKKPKPILALIDEVPILLPIQYKFWSWMAGYYGCTLGEVMHAALPAHLRLASETTITLSPLFEDDFSGLDDQEYLIAEALKIQKELSLQDVRGILQRKTVFPVIRRLMDKKIIYLKEDLKDRFRPKKAACVRLQEPYASDRRRLEDAFALCGRSNRQLEALMAYVQLARQQEHVRKTDIYKLAKADASVVSDFLPPLLEACGKVAPGSLRVVGRTDPVPFITVFARRGLSAGERAAVSHALKSASREAALLDALESKRGFVDLDAEQRPCEPITLIARDAPDPQHLADPPPLALRPERRLGDRTLYAATVHRRHMCGVLFPTSKTPDATEDREGTDFHGCPPLGRCDADDRCRSRGPARAAASPRVRSHSATRV